MISLVLKGAFLVCNVDNPLVCLYRRETTLESPCQLNDIKAFETGRGLSGNDSEYGPKYREICAS